MSVISSSSKSVDLSAHITYSNMAIVVKFILLYFIYAPPFRVTVFYCIPISLLPILTMIICSGIASS